MPAVSVSICCGSVCSVQHLRVCRVCVVFMWPFVWGLAAPPLTTSLCFPPSRLRAALFPTVFHRIFANGESSLCPTWGSVCAPSAPLCGCPVHAVVGASPVPLPPLPNYVCVASALPARLPFHNLLVSCGFCLAGHLHPGFLFPLIIRLVP